MTSDSDRVSLAAVEALVGGGVFVGRAHVPAETAGHRHAAPRVVAVRPDGLFDLSLFAATMSDFLDLPDPASAARSDDVPRVADVGEALEEAHYGRRRPGRVRLLSPADLQAVKGVGVTFASTALRRTLVSKIGERAERVLDEIVAVHGDLSGVTPGDAASASIKEHLQALGLWTPYLEVAFGKEPEVFPKAAVLTAVGTGERVGVRRRSTASQPEPELVFFLNSAERPIGVSLGNDIDLRDFEGRSPYLVAQYKDSHGGASIGPWIRLLDEHFTPESLLPTAITEEIVGTDGFRVAGAAEQSGLSRPLASLIAEVGGGTHHFPDGLALFIGCSFVPDEPRGASDGGFTLKPGDRIRISHPEIGALVNWVGLSEELPPPEMSIRRLHQALAAG